MLWVAVIQVVCAVGFLTDLVIEFPDPRAWPYLSASGVVHLVTELGIMALLVVGVVLARQAIRQAAQERDRARAELRSLRGDFDRILQAHFSLWNLTPAQRDIALLTLRGLPIERIAQLRGSAPGTVKAHLNAIYRAGGFHTRSELVGFFMDELLDHGASEARPAP